MSAPAPRTASDTAAALRDAVLAYDHDAIVRLLAEDVVLRSPIVRFPFEGRADVAFIYRTVLDGFEGFEFLDGAGDEHGVQMLRFRSKVRGRETQTISLLRVRDDGLIGEVVIAVRPLVSVAAVGAVMGPALARRHGRLRWLAMVVLSRPLPPVLELAEPLLPRLLRRRV